ncbi:MAG TPA: hypothetical protein VGL53_31635 [Bryobacteraceae bacterium]|jgi:hypothetical protein
MGAEVMCKGHLGRESGEGKAMLETDFIQFRSDELRFKIVFKELTAVRASGDVLELQFAGKKARLELGAKVAERWASKILNPPGRLDKLGLKPGTTVFLEGSFERAFAREVEGREAELPVSDLIFLAAPQADELAKIVTLAKKMRADAGLWVVYPKGRTDIREIDIINAGRAAGLKDVKVMRFSETETALKFVVPVRDR